MQSSVAQLVSSSLIGWFWIFVAIFAIAGFAIAVNAMKKVQNQNGIQIDVTPTTHTTLTTSLCNNRGIVYLPTATETTPSARLPFCPANATIDFIPGTGSLDGTLNIIGINGLNTINVKTGVPGPIVMTKGRRIVCTNGGSVTNLSADWSCLITEGISDPMVLKEN